MIGLSNKKTKPKPHFCPSQSREKLSLVVGERGIFINLSIQHVSDDDDDDDNDDDDTEDKQKSSLPPDPLCTPALMRSLSAPNPVPSEVLGIWLCVQQKKEKRGSLWKLSQAGSQGPQGAQCPW